MVDSVATSAGPEVLVAFLNTLDQRTFARYGERHEPHDELDSPTALGRLLADWGLLGGSGVRARATAEDLADALAVRAALRNNLVAALDDGGDDDDDVGSGDDDGGNDGGGDGRASAAIPTTPTIRTTASVGAGGADIDVTTGELSAFRLYLVADRSGGLALACAPPRPSPVSQALAALVTAAATAGVRGTWDRIRVCAAPDCRWAFIDASRRGDKRWCSTAVCGNRSKTAGYRVRQRESHSES